MSLLKIAVEKLPPSQRLSLDYAFCLIGAIESGCKAKDLVKLLITLLNCYGAKLDNGNNIFGICMNIITCN